MRKIAQIALGLTVAAFAHSPAPLVAQSGLNPAPVPGPYQVIIRRQPTSPAYQPQPYAQPIPYWMQSQSRPGTQVSGAGTAQAQIVSRSQQQPFIQGWSWSPPTPNAQAGNENNQGYGPAPTPGYFPGYAAGQQPQQIRPGPNYANRPWGQQQGGMPMTAPWGNGWGNNWNNNGYGYPQGYPAPPQPQQ